jgi:hypothetical protein
MTTSCPAMGQGKFTKKQLRFVLWWTGNQEPCTIRQHLVSMIRVQLLIWTAKVMSRVPSSAGYSRRPAGK